MEESSLILPAFIAGILTFLAPCTLPLVPGFLSFISGASLNDLKDPQKVNIAKRKIFMNGVYYVVGFSAIFVILGSAFGAAGSYLAPYRIWLARFGGLFVIFFGLYIMGIFKIQALNFLNKEKKFRLIGKLDPGKPSSSFLFGATFALGWSPCVGPILGSILLLASTSGSVLQGAFLLSVFSLGLAVPFLLIALGIGHASKFISRFSKYLHIVEIIGGLLLVILGYLLISDKLVLYIGKLYELFEFINYDRLYDFL